MSPPPASVYHWTVVGIALVVFKFAVHHVSSIRTAFSRIRDCPGRLVLWLDPIDNASIILGPKFPRSGMCGSWAAKFSLYKRLGSTSFASVNIFTGRHIFWVADQEARKVLSSDRHTFQKDVVKYGVLNIYGSNLVSAEGPTWKRHRSVAMSAFNEANVALVWSETLRVIDEWLAQLDALGSNVAVDMLPAMSQATLLIIAAAGFGKRISWIAESKEDLPPGCQLTFHSAVITSTRSLFFNVLMPEWFYKFLSIIKVPCLSSRAQSTRLAFNNLRTHMLDLVASARADIISSKHADTSAALLQNLVEANMNESGDSKRLTEDELLSNIFVFLLAGHETSSHALCFIFVLLALHPECQRKLYEETARVWSADTPTTQLKTNCKEYIEKFEYTMACIREGLRMYPPEPRIDKVVHADVVLPGTFFIPGSKDTPSVETGKFSMVVPAGSIVVIDVWAVHFNSLYWGEDAEEFKPERFIDTETYRWPRSAFWPFSLGARSCIGERFAYAEMIGTIVSVVRRYEVLVPDDLVGKPLEMQKEALLKWTTGVALTPLNARVKLRRRA